MPAFQAPRQIYHKLEINPRIKPRRRLQRHKPEPLPGPTHQTWFGLSIPPTQPGTTQQNGNVERFNRTVRHKWLDQASIEEARHVALHGLRASTHKRHSKGHDCNLVRMTVSDALKRSPGRSAKAFSLGRVPIGNQGHCGARADGEAVRLGV